MKKFFILLFLIIPCVILLCSCGAESSESSSSLPESGSSSESSSASSVPRLPSRPDAESHEDSPYGGSAFKDDPTVKYLGMADETEVYQKAVETGEMRLDIVYGKDGVFNTTTEVPATEYWIIDSEGNLLIEHPFYDLRFWEGNELFEIAPYIYSGIEGCWQGNRYTYSFLDKKFELVEYIEAGIAEPVENHPEYIRTRYSYSDRETHYGLNDKDGNVIFEPVFSYYINIPFENRFLLSTNNVDRMDGWENFSTLMDTNKNILAVYNLIYFHFFDDGTYIGIAWYPGCGENWGHYLYDENGELLEEGYRFIDKNGNELSTCFDSDFLLYGAYEYVEKHLDEIITTVDENGNTLEFTGRDFICEP